jgi:hypothetical protein
MRDPARIRKGNNFQLSDKEHPMTATRYPLLGLAFAAVCSHAGANDGHKLLSSLSEKDRNARLTELLSKVPEPCAVERNFFRGVDAEGAALWTAVCTSKKAYMIMILDDGKGSTRFADCKALMERVKVDCFKKI